MATTAFSEKSFIAFNGIKKFIILDIIAYDNLARQYDIVVDHSYINKKYDWQNLRGKYKGKLSSTEKFINNKRIEKRLEL